MKLDKSRKLWYLLLRKFWLLLPKINFWSEDLALACTPTQFGNFLFISLFSKILSLKFVRQLVSQLLYKVYYARYQVSFNFWVCSTYISYHLYFLGIPKVWSILQQGSVGRVHSKECYFIFTYTFLAFCCCFSLKNVCFFHFHFLFWWSIEFLQQNINQSETWIGDKKLSVELYVWWIKLARNHSKLSERFRTYCRYKIEKSI